MDGFVLRAWLYSLGITAAVGALLFTALRSASPGARREIFRDLGVAGVLFLLAAWLIASSEPYLLSDSSSAGLFVLPGAAMLLAAAAGGVATASAEPAGTRERLSSIPPLSIAAVALAALTLVLVLVGESGHECDGDGLSGWAGKLLGAGFFTGIAAGICGLISLFKRRWLAALVAIPAPVLGLAGVFIAACLE